MAYPIPLAVLMALILQACATTAPLYIPSSKVKEPPPQPDGYTLETRVKPRIGLFDELLYSCKQDYSKRIADELISREGVLPDAWDAVLPRLNNAEPKRECLDTHLGALRSRNVEIEVRLNGEQPAGGCDWTSGLPVFQPALSDASKSNSCIYRGRVDSNDAIPFKVRIGDTVLSGLIPRDFLIVSMGDSYASGEGNPDGALSSDSREATWMSRRCHRSLWAGPIRAGMTLARKRQPTGSAHSHSGAYTILSTACSGAELRDITTRGYPGRETLEQMSAAFADASASDKPDWVRHGSYAAERRLAPQLEQITGILAGYTKDDGLPLIDVLVMSMGGNDINFGQLVIGLVTNRNLLDRESIARNVSEDINSLDDDFRTVARMISSSLSVDQVFLTGYPDPTIVAPARKNDEPSYCDCGRHGFIGLGPIERKFLCISQDENRAASRSVIKPLNAALASVAEKYGWLFVPDVETALVEHAWCQDADGPVARYVRTFNDSMELQGALPGTFGLTTGAMHPSANGHEKAYMEIIRGLIESDRQTVKFSIAEEHVAANDGTLIVPPLATLEWSGPLLPPAAAGDLCERKINEGYCPETFPRLWWRHAGGSDFLCVSNGTNHCTLDMTRSILTLPLTTPANEARELLVKARDANTKAILPTQTLGKLRVDSQTPDIAGCQVIYPEMTIDCRKAPVSDWVRASGGRVELQASVGISGFRSWRCEGNLDGGCGTDPVLKIDRLPGGTSRLLTFAENRVGVRSAPHLLTLKVDDLPPAITDIEVAGYRFGNDEPLVVLTRRPTLEVAYHVEDDQAGIARPLRKKRGRDCVAEMNVRKTISFKVDHDGMFVIMENDCAMPAGNIATRNIEVIRPSRQHAKVPALTQAQWRARLTDETDEHAQFHRRLMKLSPRFSNMHVLGDFDQTLLAAWLNLVSGRISPDNNGGVFACTNDGKKYYSSAFSLLKAADACSARYPGDTTVETAINASLRKAYLLGPRTKQPAK